MKRGLALALVLFVSLTLPAWAAGEGLSLIPVPAEWVAPPLLPREEGDGERVTAQELEQAIALGLADEVGEEQMTYRTFFPILDRLVALVNPTVEDLWQNRYPWARALDTPMLRSMGVYLTFCAAETLGNAYLLDVDPAWGVTNAAMGLDVWDDYVMDWELIPDAIEYAVFSSRLEGDRHAIAYFFSFAQYSRTTGNRLFDYDPASNTMRLKDPFTKKEALLAAIRLYNARRTPAP